MDQCNLCRTKNTDEVLFGKLLTKKDVCVHTFCLYTTSNLCQKERDCRGILGFRLNDIKDEVQRTRKQICCYCRNRYAHIGCCDPKCRQTFHYSCGLENGVQNQFCGTFQSFCHNHAKKQTARPAPKEQCCICYDNLIEKGQKFDDSKMIRAPCCTNGWFHKYCLQNFAMSAGYFFKCPLCNNTNKFRNDLRLVGIFIPDIDASWELEPNAFADLMERPSECSAPQCLMRHRRVQEDLLICMICGSKAIHPSCMPKKSTSFQCDECVEISINLSRNSSDDETSDVDVVSLDEVKEGQLEQRSEQEYSSDKSSYTSTTSSNHSEEEESEDSFSSTHKRKETDRFSDEESTVVKRRKVSHVRRLFSDSSPDSDDNIRPLRPQSRAVKRRRINSDSSVSSNSQVSRRASKRLSKRPVRRSCRIESDDLQSSDDDNRAQSQSYRAASDESGTFHTNSPAKNSKQSHSHTDTNFKNTSNMKKNYAQQEHQITNVTVVLKRCTVVMSNDDMELPSRFVWRDSGISDDEQIRCHFNNSASLRRLIEKSRNRGNVTSASSTSSSSTTSQEDSEYASTSSDSEDPIDKFAKNRKMGSRNDKINQCSMPDNHFNFHTNIGKGKSVPGSQEKQHMQKALKNCDESSSNDENMNDKAIHCISKFITANNSPKRTPVAYRTRRKLSLFRSIHSPSGTPTISPSPDNRLYDLQGKDPIDPRKLKDKLFAKPKVAISDTDKNISIEDIEGTPKQSNSTVDKAISEAHTRTIDENYEHSKSIIKIQPQSQSTQATCIAHRTRRKSCGNAKGSNCLSSSNSDLTSGQGLKKNSRRTIAESIRSNEIDVVDSKTNINEVEQSSDQTAHAISKEEATMNHLDISCVAKRTRRSQLILESNKLGHSETTEPNSKDGKSSSRRMKGTSLVI